MKKIRLIVLVLAFAGLVCSCSKQHESASESEPVTYEQLTQSLGEYSSTFTSSVETKRPFWRALGRIVMCDAFGAAVGGSMLGPGGSLFGAIAGSLAQFVTEIIEINYAAEETPSLDNFYNRGISLYGSGMLLDESDSLGILHNQILGSILDEQPDIANMTDDEINALIIDKIDEAGQILPFTTATDYRFYSELCEGGDPDGMFDDIVSRYPSIRKEMQVVKIYFETIANIDENDIPEYTRGFRLIVDRSNTIGISKSLIISTISVAGSSKLFWKEEAFQAVLSW